MLMPYLHLPVQSGSDPILKAMNRSHTTRAFTLERLKVRAARPDIAISGDFIVGFPEKAMKISPPRYPSSMRCVTLRHLFVQV